MFELDSTVSKLILLLVLEQMEIPLTEQSILDICTNRNQWINYMECKYLLFELLEANFIYKTDGSDVSEQKYNITYDGRNCLSMFYKRIDAKLKNEIVEFAKENRMHFKRAQEYLSKYEKNNDGSHTVTLKILAPQDNQSLLELKVKTPSRHSAIEACKKWGEKAHIFYEYIFESLIDDD